MSPCSAFTSRPLSFSVFSSFEAPILVRQKMIACSGSSIFSSSTRRGWPSPSPATSTKAWAIASTVSCLRRDFDRHRVVHVALGEPFDRRRHRRREERRLAPARAHPQDLLDVLDEAQVEHLVGLVEDDVAGRGEDQRAARHQVHHPADGGDDDVGAGAQLRLLRFDRRAAEDGDDLDVEVLGVGAQRLGHLDAELAGRREDDRLHLVVGGVDVLEQGQAEGGGLAGPGLRLADHVVAAEQLRDRFLLDRAGLLVAELVQRLLDLRRQPQVLEGDHFDGSKRSLPLVRRAIRSSWARAASESG